MTPRYRTSPADVAEPPWTDDGWSIEPLIDGATGLYARLTGRDGLAVCAARGWRLPTRAEVLELHAEAVAGRAVEIAPVILPDILALRMAGIALDDEAGKQRLRDLYMQSRQWAEAHDLVARQRLAALGWDGRIRVANVGKCVISGEGEGLYLCGWWDGRRWIQGGERAISGPLVPGSHSADDFTDYATLHIVRRLV